MSPFTRRSTPRAATRSLLRAPTGRDRRGPRGGRPRDRPKSRAAVARPAALTRIQTSQTIKTQGPDLREISRLGSRRVHAPWVTIPPLANAPPDLTLPPGLDQREAAAEALHGGHLGGTTRRLLRLLDAYAPRLSTRAPRCARSRRLPRRICRGRPRSTSSCRRREFHHGGRTYRGCEGRSRYSTPACAFVPARRPDRAGDARARWTLSILSRKRTRGSGAGTRRRHGSRPPSRITLQCCSLSDRPSVCPPQRPRGDGLAFIAVVSAHCA